MVVLGGVNEDNSAELVYLLMLDKWGKRFGTELVGSVVLFYAPLLMEMNYKSPDGKPFQRIVATTRKDNKASEKILQNLGMTEYKEPEEKYGAERKFYELNLVENKQ